MGKFFASFKPLFSWLRSVYSESDGSGSSTRVHMAVLISFVVGVGVSFSVSVHHKLITLEQFNSFLSAGSTFIVTCCGALYGINKLGDWAGTRNPADATTATTAVVADATVITPPVLTPPVASPDATPDVSQVTQTPVVPSAQ